MLLELNGGTPSLGNAHTLLCLFSCDCLFGVSGLGFRGFLFRKVDSRVGFRVLGLCVLVFCWFFLGAWPSGAKGPGACGVQGRGF